MSVRNLEHLFRPRSIAVIGASNRPGSVGAVVARNLFNAGFAGPVMPVNPRWRAVEGVLAYPDVASLPLTPDLAVIATPPATVPGLVAELGERGVKAAVVITAGLGAAGEGGEPGLRQQMLDAAQPHLMRIVGPNCIGIMAPGVGLNASFAHIGASGGDLAFVTQSGAMVTALLDWASARGVGFSHCVSLGDMADVDFGDMLDYLAADASARAVLLYVEAVTHARKFMSALRACARLKPVVVIKSGRHAEGARAAASHTGAMAGSDAVYDAAFRRAGALRVSEMHELFDAAETLGSAPARSGERLAILTNGGGPGVLAIDALIDLKGRPAELSAETMARLDAVLPPTWSRGNPVDIIGDAPPDRYAKAMEILLEDRGADAVLVINCPTAIGSSTEAARVVARAARGARRTILTNWLGDPGAEEARRLFAANRIPTFDTPEQAIRGFMHIVRYRRAQDMLMETPASAPEEFTPDAAAARAIIRKALAEGREWLSEAEAKDVVAAYGVPVAPTRVVATPGEAALAAEALEGPAALKILSRDITHKSDVGGVALGLETPEAVRAAAEAMLRRVAEAAPEARLDGFTVQPMIRRPRAYELIIGMTEDVQFGPVLLFGHGGTGVEVIDDKALGLPPLNMNLAHEMISDTRVFRQLQGFRDRPAVALDAVALTLIKISQLITDHAEVVELDVNPLLADEHGVIALDARVRVAEAAQPGASRLAIHPYPRELEQELVVSSGARYRLRPIRPEDGNALHVLFRKLHPEDVRLRFFTPMKTLPAPLAARLSQVDYEREMAFIVIDPAAPEEILGVVRIDCDPDLTRAEFAVLVRSDMKGRGIGYGLMSRIIEQARSMGVKEIFGDILQENRRMLNMCRDFGFTTRPTAEDPTILRATLQL